MMTYELCGPPRCSAHYRLSDDGWNWGNPTNVGSEIRLPNGEFPAHAPRFTVAPDGAIMLVGQLIETSQLKLGAPEARWCPNYSSSLLTARNGAQVLEFASDWTDRGCFSSYGWSSLRRDASLSRRDAP